MKMHNTSFIHQVSFSILLSFLFSYIVYFGFTTNYTGKVYSVETFENQYDNSVYKYRILGREITLWTHRIVQKYVEDNTPSKRISLLDSKASKSFYLTYFLLNSIFLALFCVAACMVFNFTNHCKLDNQRTFSILFMFISIICITQYVITPYDLINHFFFMIGIFLFFKYREQEKPIYYFLLLLLIPLATLNRETSALIISFGLSLYFITFKNLKKVLRIFTPISFLFLITYVGLRIYYPKKDMLIAEVTKFENLFLPSNIIGLVTMILLFYFSIQVANTKENKRMIYRFHFFSLPYLIVILCGGILWEIRLYIPIFIGNMVLANTMLSKEK